MEKKKVAFLTLGCKVNSYETDAMQKKFKDAEYDIVEFESDADIYVVNTCSVTNMADRKSRQMLHKAKKLNPAGIVVATGCYVQTSKNEAMDDLSIDIVIGNNQKANIVQIIQNYMYDESNNEAVININEEQCYEEMAISSTAENTRAYIKIQDGCNQFCSYCIIPYARGRIRSRKKEDILSEVQELAKSGYKEVVLTGIHISSYGMDFEAGKTTKFIYKYLLELINDISLIDNINRIRLGSLEPRIITEKFIEQLAMNKKLCPHFHLSLQSGCDETLKRMNRKYTTKIFMEKCEILRSYFDEPALTTDVIVGFPQESEGEFADTYEFLNKIDFSQMHIFKYSRRKGTVADKLPGQINDDIKTKRSKMLLNMSLDNHKRYISNMINSIQTVLFEEIIEINGKHYNIGHNERYVKIALEGKELLSNQIIEVHIKGLLTNEILLADL